VEGRVPVFAGAGSISTKSCIRFADMARGAGADALTVLTPMFVSPSDDELYIHFKTIAEHSKLPLLLYNNPGKTGNNISMGLLKKLAGIDNIVGIKNTTLDLSQSLHFLHETRGIKNFKILAGSDFYIYSLLAHGGAGAVAGTANVAPALVVEIYERFNAGDHQGAIEAQNRLFPLRNAYGLASFPVVMKDCLNLMGMNIGSAVKPIQNCSGEQLEALKVVLKDLKLIDQE
jgi:4-hydroxy-tetrahydrodipicolinate synthase